ncbi:MAG: hypothetical protein QMD03_09360 [Syntrophales bacterium]|nr:hypothetical protein [Syntrophales bacterium]
MITTLNIYILRCRVNISASASYLKSEDASTYPEYDDSALPTGEKYNNFHDGVISACLPISVGEYLTVAPTISYVFPLCNDARNEMKGRGSKGTTPADRDSSFLYGGLILTTSF